MARASKGTQPRRTAGKEDKGSPPEPCASSRAPQWAACPRPGAVALGVWEPGSPAGRVARAGGRVGSSHAARSPQGRGREGQGGGSEGGGARGAGRGGPSPVPGGTWGRAGASGVQTSAWVPRRPWPRPLPRSFLPPPAALSGHLGSIARGLGVRRVGPTPGAHLPPISLAPHWPCPPRAHGPPQQALLASGERGATPTERGSHLGALGWEASAAILGAGLLAGLRALCGESPSQLLPRPGFARQRRGL